VGDYGYSREGENVPSLLHFWSDDGILMHSIHGSKGEYRNITWNQDGTRLATASDVLRIWDAEGSLLYESPEDGSNYLWGVSWNHDGTRIVTASRHKTIAIWDQKAKMIRRLDVP
jgi:WD40 repeat protein